MASPLSELNQKIELQKLLHQAQTELQRDKLSRESSKTGTQRTRFGRYVARKIREIELVLPLMTATSIDSSRQKK